MKFAYKMIDRLMERPTRLQLMTLNKVLALGIPFNVPHGFKVKELSENAVMITLPDRKLNHNHLGGIHACAIATLGEFCAGLSILHSFGISKYRIILSELKVTYTYQGRTDLVGICSPQHLKTDAMAHALATEGKFFQTLETRIKDKNENEVAVVTTTWQLKAWDQVKSKD